MPLPDLSGLLRLQANPSQVAVQGFMNEYVPHSHFDYLPRFYPLLCASDPQIDLALSVPALALLSKHLRQPVIMHHAYERYEKLVQITQKALNQNVTATHDSTLLHILLLALFENIVLQGRQNPSNWNTHIHGSAALLNMRGCQQFQQPFSRQLFRHASHIIRVSCILKRLPVPRLLSELDFPKENNSRLKTDFNFGNLFDDLADLRANKMKWPAEKRLQRYHDLDERVSAVLAMISKIAVLQRVTSPSILTNVSHHLDYGHGVDTYGSLRFAQQMNALRMIRIFLNGAICNSGVTTGNANEEQEAILSGPASVIQLPAAEVTSICEVAMANCEGATKGILRSVPFFVDLQPSFAVNSLIGPLYAVKGSFLASKSATDFAKSVLHYIGEEYGISQAVELAAAPEGCHNLEDWYASSFVIGHVGQFLYRGGLTRSYSGCSCLTFAELALSQACLLMDRGLR